MHHTNFTATAAFAIPHLTLKLPCRLMAKGGIGRVALDGLEAGANIITKLPKPARSSILPLSTCWCINKHIRHL
jgi:hypothetical protein